MSRPETDWWDPITVGTTADEFPPVDPVADATPFDVAHHVALAWVLDHSRTSILLVEHRALRWSCPGGHLEPGESLLAAARRELAEETGIVTPPFVTAPITLARSTGCPRSPLDDTVHWAAGFAFLVDPSTVMTTEPGQRARWFDVRRLPPGRPSDIDLVVARVAAPDPRRTPGNRPHTS